MIGLDEDSLICDLAETYHIFNYREYPVSLIATLANGLRKDSRIKQKLSGQDVTMDSLLNACILDELRFISWSKTKDASKNKNRPKSVAKSLLGLDKKKDKTHITFSTCEEFEKARRELLAIGGGR
jgi:hypothetical protein